MLACLTGDRKYFQNDLGVIVGAHDGDIVVASQELYQGITGFPKPRADADVAIFSMLGTYGAKYLVGNTLFHTMEEQAASRQGSRFKRAEFHEAILREGMMPLSYIARALEHIGIM